MKTHKNLSAIILGVLLLTTLAACSAAPAAPTATVMPPVAMPAAVVEPTATTQSAAAAAPATSSASGMASLTVENNSNVEIFYLYISPSTSSDWGNDMLGSSTLPIGSAYTVTDIPVGTYDLKVEDSAHNIVNYQMAIDLTGDMTWTIVGSSAGYSLTVINNSGVDIYYVYVSPTASSTWGPDILGSNIIANGTTFTISGIPSGAYDLMAEDSSHNTVVVNTNVNLTADATWTISP